MVRKRPAGDPAQRAEARGVRAARGNWQDVGTRPNVLSLSKDARRKAKSDEVADAAEAAASEPDMFAGGVAAE